MTAKELLAFIRLKAKHDSRMVDIKETMALQEAAETYARYICKMRDWKARWMGNITDEFRSIVDSFMDGYIKAMHDNGYVFKNGLVKKRDIMEEMPVGALEYYRKDAIAETKAKAVEVLRRVMEKYETSKQNINVIVNEFEREIKKEE